MVRRIESQFRPPALAGSSNLSRRDPMTNRKVLGVLVVAGLTLALAACRRAPVAPPSAMVGNWEGQADIAVNWCKAKELPIALTINRDGSVAGHVGDAALKDARIYPNPGRPPKGFTLQTKYVIEADLEGPLVAAEGIQRSDICIPVQVTDDGTLEGAFMTSGKEYGETSERIFSGGLRPLTKVQAH
jgi:hypothetical protein